MCGIVGVLNLLSGEPVEEAVLLKMLGMIRHRGPDGFGIYRDHRAGLGSARLSIIDLSGGFQPISNEDGTLWIVFNGEIFNYVELRPDLERRGHRFTTQSDTEVILHLYEEHGPDCLSYLNGQFAMAIWDETKQTLFLARDRVGIRPLFYTITGGRLVFGSEVKALLAHPGISVEIDPQALDQVFTYWSVQPPHSIFRGVFEVPPGHYLLAQDGKFDIQRYWSLDFSGQTNGSDSRAACEALEELLIDSVRLRLRADVPVGAYLSGGLDSSITAALIRNYTHSRLDTFSISFSDPDFDESPYQREMAEYLGTDHQVAYCSHEEIGEAFPEVIWHTETPILRTAPVPMFLLSQKVHDLRYKVVVTGEGADEVLAGYDIFKEMKIRRFWARNPASMVRPLLLGRLYPEINGLSNGAYLKAFFKQGLAETASPYYSHSIRWANTARTRRFLSGAAGEELRSGLDRNHDRLIQLPNGYSGWPDLSKAQYLEMVTFLSPYLLSSQGDRVAMAHSVEGRFPFLDYRVIEFCNRLPPDLKLWGLTEKWLLKKLGRRYLPDRIWKRRKRPYRAPIQRSFFSSAKPEQGYIGEMLSPEAVRKSGYFDVDAVNGLVRKAKSGARLNEVDEMALVGILSTQLVHHHFVESFRKPAETPEQPLVAIDHAAQNLES